jgi:hypothetical protein
MTGSMRWPVATAALVLTAWATFLATGAYATHLAEQYGPAPDVVDALGRDTDIARRTWPGHTAVLLLDLAAFFTLSIPSRPGWPRVLKVVVAVLLVPGAVLHGLVWLLTMLFV